MGDAGGFSFFFLGSAPDAVYLEMGIPRRHHLNYSDPGYTT